jgi:uncharacterized repeat protein (TIGR01451 family)
MTGASRRTALALTLLVLAATPAAAQEDVAIVKRTNGQDANSPPGPVVAAGSTVTWTYQVTNVSARDLANVVVTDDQGVTVTCPGTTLPAGESMTCTASGVATAGQYANVGTVQAERQDTSVTTASDPSHYFGQAADAVALEKRTAGLDADTPPGPILAVGDPVGWEYEVTNIGADALSEIAVVDDQGVVVSCPGTTLAPGASMVCTGAGTVQPGQYANVGSVTATLPDESVSGATDPSHYFGQILLLEKATEGQDADLPPGPVLDGGVPVTWTYTVTNPGPATITGIAVTDDVEGAVSCPQTTLAAGESVVCTLAGTTQAGQYANVGTATATLPLGGTVSASDPSHYVGLSLRLEKSTNGEDADLPPGPVLAVGAPVAWAYQVTNLGVEAVTNVAVTDDQGVTVTCPGTTLAAGAAMTCTANGTALAGQYSNVGTATADHPTFGEIADSDPSHYFGQDQVLDFGDAPDPTFPTGFAANGARHLLGSGVFLGACVDSELDAQPSAGSDGDDATAGISTFGTCAASGDDEDGVAFTTALVPGGDAGVEVTASAPCTLSAWIDFDASGGFTSGDELFPGGVALVAGSNALTFAVPAGAAGGVHQSRFRCTTTGVLAPAGEAADGEVEDHLAVVGAPALTATKSATLAIDGDGDGSADPGDTLAYTVTIGNAGPGDAFAVAFADTPDPLTALVVGSVTTTQGAVTTGNGAGDTMVNVDVGTLAAASSVTIGFQVVIDDPLPDGVTQVANQGTVSGSFATLTTDDPAAPGATDPTVTVLGAGPSLLEIPTASTGALALLAFALAGLGLRRLLAR